MRFRTQNALVFLFLTCFSGKVLTVLFELTGKDENVTSIKWHGRSNSEVSDNLNELRTVDAVLYKTVKRYPCYSSEDRGVELMLSGSQAWNFPEQNIELTLSYPSKNVNREISDMFENHLVTGLEVVLYTSGVQTKAFISSGGLLQKNISLTFLCEDTTSLGYQLWIYGAPEDVLNSGSPLREPVWSC